MTLQLLAGALYLCWGSPFSRTGPEDDEFGAGIFDANPSGVVRVLWWDEFGCWKWTKLWIWASYDWFVSLLCKFNVWFVSLLNFDLKYHWLISKQGLEPTNQIYLAGTQTKQTHFRATFKNPSPFPAHLLVWPNDAACCETFSFWRQVDRSGRHDSNRFGGPPGSAKWRAKVSSL